MAKDSVLVGAVNAAQLIKQPSRKPTSAVATNGVSIKGKSLQPRTSSPDQQTEVTFCQNSCYKK